MKPKTSNISLPLLGIIALTTCGCSSEAPTTAEFTRDVQRVESETLDELAARTAAPGRPGEYLVEGDMLLSYDALAHYYEARLLRDKAIVTRVRNKTTGQVFDAARADPTNLRYCLTDGWGGTQASKASVVAALQAAINGWSGASRVRFVYASALDGAGCTQALVPASVDFVVRPNVSAPNAAYAWWRYGPVQELGVGTNMAFRAAMEHELGHVLGLDHEQHHDNAGLGCAPASYPGPADTNLEWSNQRELTAYDNASIMHYYTASNVASCSGGTSTDRRISMLDGVGVRGLYGNPHWWAGWVPATILL